MNLLRLIWQKILYICIIIKKHMPKGEDIRYKIRHFLGYKDFQNIKKIIEVLKEEDPSQNYDISKCIKIQDGKTIKIWVLSTDEDILIVRDNGFNDIRVIYRRPKARFNFVISRENGKPTLCLEDATASIPLNSPIGGTEFLSTRLNALKNG